MYVHIWYYIYIYIYIYIFAKMLFWLRKKRCGMQLAGQELVKLKCGNIKPNSIILDTHAIENHMGLGQKPSSTGRRYRARENQNPCLVLFPYQMASVFFLVSGTGLIFELQDPVASKNCLHFSIFKSLKWQYLSIPCIRIAQSHFFEIRMGG